MYRFVDEHGKQRRFMHSIEICMACSVVCISRPSVTLPLLPWRLVIQKDFNFGRCRHTAMQRPLRICTEGGRPFEWHCITTTSSPGTGWSISKWTSNAALQQSCTTLGIFHHEILALQCDFGYPPKTSSTVRMRRSSICTHLHAATGQRCTEDAQTR